MVIVFARSKSDAIAKADGTFEVRLDLHTLPCPRRIPPSLAPICNVKEPVTLSLPKLRPPRDAGEGV